MTTRRQVIKTLALTPAVGALSLGTQAQASKQEETRFIFSLNTSTVRGQKLSLPKLIELAARAGYQGLEPWMMEIESYLKEGNSIASLKKLANDAGITLVDCIGFPTWMAQDEEKSKAGFIQMEKEMGILAELGCTRVAAPAIGAEAPLDLLKAGERYKKLLDLGRKTGVMPQLEFWGAYPAFFHLSQALAVAAAADDSDAKILADVYHLFRGGSGFEGLKLIDGQAISIFHLNDFPKDIPRTSQQDKDRVFPGDGAAPLQSLSDTLRKKGGEIVLSLELFNPEYYAMDPNYVAKTGLEKMKQFF
ncbi:MAG: sugar phosphate isomerase/epimerase [Algoriphagus sp.]|jgi:2-keto-myo-inositol isomerase|uniref:sugar phosphate isomerase/epimerase family protein n=1 Tax=Algoriphagus sp. TaxID=1872435 RepID=UPI00274E05CF|nr:sugar phosphate isomerase/epimerase [Algoriphagus sp.]MDP4748359.1 sugar phosphate isomerase/epimerase [Algoriphagus sp.]MDP4839705.1 sugar phosphate isomerase/epimerase [Algoriphagus sp.]MDP4957726.1 sugar phosphate isomerase/epimerase [Algoriphagus sp.]MDP5125342.1 sugar phosphate isomerase/epimerase [Algoriphagus sp.]